MSWLWGGGGRRKEESDSDSDYEDDDDEEYSGSDDDDDESEHHDDHLDEPQEDPAVEYDKDTSAAAAAKEENHHHQTTDDAALNDSMDADTYHYRRHRKPESSSQLAPATDDDDALERSFSKLPTMSAACSQAESHEESTIMDDDASNSCCSSNNSSNNSRSHGSSTDEDVAAGRIPAAVSLIETTAADAAATVDDFSTPEYDNTRKLRRRVDSAVSSLHDDNVGMSDDDMDDDEGAAARASLEMEATTDEPLADNDEEEDDEEKAGDNMDQTSLSEKRSLLLLAAEHDRVDIIQAILGSSDAATVSDLMNPTTLPPPLHVSVSYGSVNATNCLLRRGADPGIRPQLQNMLASEPASNQWKNMTRFEGLSAWEVVHGVTPEFVSDHGDDENNQSSAASASRKSMSSSSRRRNRATPIVDLAPSKREGIRHAFTAEALRCIGSDEVVRLQQLLKAGMPPTIDIGGKTLCDWSVTMEAVECEKLLLQTSGQSVLAAKGPGEGANIAGDTVDSSTNGHAANIHQSRILDREEEQDSLAQLANRLDELASLGQALSISLDGLAEEVSVCNGLLLMGGGASALAIHVRSLKDTKERKMAEVVRLEEAWENSQDELAYWVQQGGSDAVKISQTMMMPRPPVLSRKSSISSIGKDDEDAERKQMKAQIAASDHKVCKLRASITDLSEALARELAEVEKRGLSGGINMVRGLREEIREFEFALLEVTNAEATCRTKISLIQSMINTSAKSKDRGDEQSAASDEQQQVSDHVTSTSNGLTSTDSPNAIELTESQVIATGQSTALTIRNEGSQGLFPFSLWEIIKRIIGFIDEPRRTVQPVMVV